MHENNIVDDTIKDKAISLKASLIYEKDQSSKGLPVYLKNDESHNHTKFVEVCLQSKRVHIHKSMAIWLFQDSERLSTDRIFRVRAKQPYESQDPLHPMPTCIGHNSTQPTVSEYILVGDICAFRGTDNSKIGRVLQFARSNKGKPVSYHGIT